MALPLVLICFALSSAWMMAYGTSGYWGRYGMHGVHFILAARRLQGPLIAFSVLASVAVIGLIAAGKKRAWWVIGLLPVMAVFGHRFVWGPATKMAVAEDPPMRPVDKVGFLQPGDYVVGFVWNQQAYALPFSAMYHTPVVVLNDRSGPLLVVFSPYANRALAVPTARDFRGRDLEIVSMPVDATIVYNGRLGQFINGVTGLDQNGKTPTGLDSPIQTYKTTWSQWKTGHPSTLAMAPYETTLVPTTSTPVVIPDPVCVVATTRPFAVRSIDVTDRPLNLTAGPTPVLLVRVNGVIRAFERRVESDLTPRFYPTTRPGKPAVAWHEDDTNTDWTAAGDAVDGKGELKGTRLTPIVVEDDLDPRIEQFWMPGLRVVTPDEIKAAAAGPKPPVSPSMPTTRPKKKRTRG